MDNTRITLLIKYSFWLIIFVFVVGRSFFLENIATKALYDFDEARYAEVAKNILKTGNWLIPMAGGPDDPSDLLIYTLANGEKLAPYFWKPPLSTQIMAVSMKLFGINELAVRIPTLVATLISIWLVFKITQRLFPQLRLAPYLVIPIFVSLNDLSFLSSQGLTEIPMLAFGLAAIYSAAKDKFRSTITAGLFFGLAFLTKSFITFWIPILCLIILWQGFNKRTLKSWLIFIITAAVTVLPWHLYMYFHFGTVFIDRYALTNILGRVEGATGNQAPVKWYFIYMLDQWKPYIFVLPVLASLLWQELIKKRKSIWLLVIWIGILLLPLSLSASKVYWYIFPIFIPIAMLISVGLESAYKQKRYLLLAVTLFATIFSLHQFWQLNLRHTPIKEFTIFFAVISLVSFFLSQKTKKLTPLLLVACILLIVGLGLKHNYQASLARRDDNAPIKNILSRHKANSNLVVLDMAYEAPLFYADSGHVDTVIQPSSQFVLTKKSDTKPSWINDFNLIDQEKEVLLYQRK